MGNACAPVFSFGVSLMSLLFNVRIPMVVLLISHSPQARGLLLLEGSYRVHQLRPLSELFSLDPLGAQRVQNSEVRPPRWSVCQRLPQVSHV